MRAQASKAQSSNVLLLKWMLLVIQRIVVQVKSNGTFACCKIDPSIFFDRKSRETLTKHLFVLSIIYIL